MSEGTFSPSCVFTKHSVRINYNRKDGMSGKLKSLTTTTSGIYASQAIHGRDINWDG